MKAIILGCGRHGSAIAVELDRNGWDVTAIDGEEDAIDRPGSHWAGGFVAGHGMELSVLEAAGIEHVDTVVAQVNDPRNQPHFDPLGIAKPGRTDELRKSLALT